MDQPSPSSLRSATAQQAGLRPGKQDKSTPRAAVAELVRRLADPTNLEWLDDRMANSERIAALKEGRDRDEWLDDARRYREIRASHDALVEALREAADALSRMSDIVAGNPDHDIAAMASAELAERNARAALALAKETP